MSRLLLPLRLGGRGIATAAKHGRAQARERGLLLTETPRKTTQQQRHLVHS